MTGADMITLSDDTLLGRNQTRDVFLHPQFPDRVLKIEKRPVPGRMRWYERPPRIESSLKRELTGYADMMIRLGRHEPYVARILGLENTNLGPAIMAEHATYGATRAGILRTILKGPHTSDFTRNDLAQARALYVSLTDMLCDHRIYTHGLRSENLMLIEMDGGLSLRMFDFKTVVYRQLISPRYVPGAQMYEQRRKIAEILGLFDSALATNFDATPVAR